VILPPAGSPTAAFTMSPLQAVQNAPVTFDASTSQVGSGASQIASYSWDFGDGTAPASGVKVTHTFASQQTFNVTLTVTNDRGLSASSRVATPVGAPPAPTPPTPLFTFSPASAGVNDTIFFNASTSTAAPGHRIVNFNWAFGDGATGTGVTTTHSYATAGTYVVQLSVLDESGQGATSAGTSITIGGASPAAPKADFTFSPTQPVVNQQVVFDSSSTTVASGQSIVDVAWNFGDDTPVIHGGPPVRITAHSFPIVGTFVVNLVVTDSVGRTGSVFHTVQVFTANPTAVLTVAKAGGLNVTADGSLSTATLGSTIATYTFIWGDGTQTGPQASSSAVHAYGVGGTYSVTLRVTDTFVPPRSGVSPPQTITVP
jgi:PKD repeat protein